MGYCRVFRLRHPQDWGIGGKVHSTSQIFLGFDDGNPNKNRNGAFLKKKETQISIIVPQLFLVPIAYRIQNGI